MSTFLALVLLAPYLIGAAVAGWLAWTFTDPYEHKGITVVGRSLSAAFYALTWPAWLLYVAFAAWWYSGPRD
jgi:hypothetical protein